jgi:hypothetical protein
VCVCVCVCVYYHITFIITVIITVFRDIRPRKFLYFNVKASSWPVRNKYMPTVLCTGGSCSTSTVLAPVHYQKLSSACSMHMEDEECTQNGNQKVWTRPHGKQTLKHFEDLECETVEWMHMVLEGVQWWCTRNTVVNLQSPQKTGIK